MAESMEEKRLREKVDKELQVEPPRKVEKIAGKGALAKIGARRKARDRAAQDIMKDL